MPETVRALRALRTPVFIFHADNPFPPHTSSRPEDLACAAASDCYFIWSRQLCERLLRLGVPRVEYLPFAWDPEIFPHLGLSAAPEHDVVFVGGWDEEREQALEPLARRFDLKIFGPAYWGSRTRRKSATRHSWQGRAPRGQEAAEIVTRSRVVLNVLRRQNLPDGTVMRTFETPGCGGVSLSTRTTGALSIFPEGIAGAYFASTDECVEQIDCLLRQPERRHHMAMAAHQIVSAGHRYFDRARRILDVYRELR
jgi:spore maturation protein CgeB